MPNIAVHDSEQKRKRGNCPNSGIDFTITRNPITAKCYYKERCLQLQFLSSYASTMLLKGLVNLLRRKRVGNKPGSTSVVSIICMMDGTPEPLRSFPRRRAFAKSSTRLLVKKKKMLFFKIEERKKKTKKTLESKLLQSNNDDLRRS